MILMERTLKGKLITHLMKLLKLKLWEINSKTVTVSCGKWQRAKFDCLTKRLAKEKL